MILEISNDDVLIKRQLNMLNYIMPKNLIATTLFSRLIGHQWEQQPNYKMVSDVSLFYNLSTTKLSRKKKKTEEFELTKTKESEKPLLYAMHSRIPQE